VGAAGSLFCPNEEDEEEEEDERSGEEEQVECKMFAAVKILEEKNDYKTECCC
jgi:hypothetical protein